MEEGANGSLVTESERKTEVKHNSYTNPVEAFRPNAPQDNEVAASRYILQPSVDPEIEAEQSRHSISRSSTCSSPPGNFFGSSSQSPPSQQPQEMQPRNIVPPLSPNPGDQIGLSAGSAGNTSSQNMLIQSPHPQQQFAGQPPYGMPNQMHGSQPQMMQMLQIPQGGNVSLLPPQLTPNGTPVEAYGDDRFLKRRKRCGECGPCKVNKNCDQCKNCLNRKVLKQTCIYRKCIYLRKKEAGGEGDILDYPSPVPPPSSADAAFVPRSNVSGGQPSQQQISPNGAGNSSGSISINNPQQQPQVALQQQSQQPPLAPSQNPQSQVQIQQQQQPQQQAQQQQPQQQQQQGSGSANNGNLPPGQQSNMPQFLSHGQQGYQQMQYGVSVMNNGFIPGGAMMPNVSAPGMTSSSTLVQHPSQQGQLPSSVNFLSPPAPGQQQQQQQQRNFVQQQQSAQQGGGMQTLAQPASQAAPLGSQQTAMPIMPQQSNVMPASTVSSTSASASTVSSQYKTTRQALQGILSEPEPKSIGANKSFAGNSGGGDSLSAILQQQQSRLTPSNNVSNGFGPQAGHTLPTSATHQNSQQHQISSRNVRQQQQQQQQSGMTYSHHTTNPSADSSLNNNGANVATPNAGGGVAYGGYGDASQGMFFNGAPTIDYFPYGGSDNPFCHLKMCGGSGHDQKFLSLISYDNSPYYGQQHGQLQQHHHPHQQHANAGGSNMFHHPQANMLHHHPATAGGGVGGVGGGGQPALYHHSPHQQQAHLAAHHPHEPTSGSSMYGGISYPAAPVPVNGSGNAMVPHR